LLISTLFRFYRRSEEEEIFMAENEPTSQGRDYFTALYNVARTVNASLDSGRVLERIIEAVIEAVGVKACSIRLLSARGESLDLVASAGLSAEYLRKGPVLLEESGIDRDVLSGRTVWIPDVRKDSGFQYPAGAEKEGILSVMALPLLVEGKAVGVLRVYAGEIRKFPDSDIRFLEAVSSLSAIAIENARLHEALKRRCDLMADHKNRIDDN